MTKVHWAVGLATNLILDHYGMNQKWNRSGNPELAEISPVESLLQKQGSVVPILGAPEMGKTVIARRLAEIIDRPTFCVSPEEKPPKWITWITLDDVLDAKKVPTMSTVILDDILLYASIRDYTSPAVQKLERTMSVARHKRKIIIIWCAQVSALVDKNLLMGPMVILKPPSLLFEDIERDAVRKLHKRAEEIWAGKSEGWLHRHCYVIGHSFEGVVKVNMARSRRLAPPPPLLLTEGITQPPPPIIEEEPVAPGRQGFTIQTGA